MMVSAIKLALSPARMETYEKAMNVKLNDKLAAIEMYIWNAQISGALLLPLHICEVVIRNAVSEVLILIYGQNWAWSTGFERSLPNPIQGYSPRKELQDARKTATSIDQVIPKLKFVFWQKMFTQRYDQRLWNAHLHQLMPNLDKTKATSVLRTEIYNSLDQLRFLRNRIAHHEPIFTRDIHKDYHLILILIRYRCTITADWVEHWQNILELLKKKPVL